LHSNVMDEFEDKLNKVAADDQMKAIVLLSGKPEMFISGADLHEISKFTTKEQAEAISRRGQKIFNFLAHYPKPTVVGIHGMCLGGGLELALCCDRRIATTDAATVIGLPETKLGFIPGLGGTQRLPRLIGLKEALEIILTADPVSPSRAKSMGIIDELV